MSLRTTDLTHRYTGSEMARKLNPALRCDAIASLNLHIHPHKRIALLGANGSGKSTLLLHLNGTLRPSHGSVSYHGKVMGYSRSELQKWRSQIALVFQEPDHQIFAGTVAQDISFGPMNLGLPLSEVRDRVAESLAALELGAFADLPPHMLSHGQRKRVALAGALALRPEVLLLDEPTAGLDPKGTQMLLDALAKLSRQGMTQVVSTHDLDLALEWADEVVILHEGRLLAQGKPFTVLANAALMSEAHLRVPFALRSAL